MTTGQLQECLEEAFGDLEPPHFEEVFACADLDGLDQAIRTETGRAKRWQELRPLRKYQLSSLALYVLTPKAYHYYLPAYLYAMIVSDETYYYLEPTYLDSVVDTLWQEGEDFIGRLTTKQKGCIAHWLVEVWKTIDTRKDEIVLQRPRIAYMLNRYWNAWL